MRGLGWRVSIEARTTIHTTHCTCLSVHGRKLYWHWFGCSIPPREPDVEVERAQARARARRSQRQRSVRCAPMSIIEWLDSLPSEIPPDPRPSAPWLWPHMSVLSTLAVAAPAAAPASEPAAEPALPPETILCFRVLGITNPVGAADGELLKLSGPVTAHVTKPPAEIGASYWRELRRAAKALVKELVNVLLPGSPTRAHRALGLGDWVDANQSAREPARRRAARLMGKQGDALTRVAGLIKEMPKRKEARGVIVQLLSTRAPIFSRNARAFRSQRQRAPLARGALAREALRRGRARTRGAAARAAQGAPRTSLGHPRLPLLPRVDLSAPRLAHQGERAEQRRGARTRREASACQATELQKTIGTADAAARFVSW